MSYSLSYSGFHNNKGNGQSVCVLCQAIKGYGLMWDSETYSFDHDKQNVRFCYSHILFLEPLARDFFDKEGN